MLSPAEAKAAPATQSAGLEALLRTRMGVFGAVSVVCALLAEMLRRLNIETPVARQVFFLAFIGFIAHFWAPARWRMGIFAALSVASVLLVFGMREGHWEPALALTRGGWLIALGLLMIGVVRAPGPNWVRAALALGIGLAFALCRVGAVQTPIPAPIWPILASMFMFRAILSLYDAAQPGPRPPLVRSLAYFFMLPNACFPFFPVVDPKVFARSRFDADEARIYFKGVWWMTRGVLHLMLYRVVCNIWRVSPADVEDGAGLAHYMLSSMGLYLRVSGLLHLIVGLLHLYGFNLPETNRRYFFASSFNDYWRRVNIYWKEFMLKVVYRPAYFRLKGLGLTAGMAVATLLAFVATWFLHAYQSFWLQGAQFPVLWKDIVFWGALGILVTANSVWEAKFGRARTLAPARGGKATVPARGLTHACKVAATFLTLTVLWSIWYADSLDEWVDLATKADGRTAAWLLGAGALVGVLSCIPVLDPPATAPGPFFRGPVMGNRFLRDIALLIVLPLVALQIAQMPRVFGRLGEPGATMVREIKHGVNPDAHAEARKARGYYEDLIDVGGGNSPLAEALVGKPPDWKRLESSDAIRSTGDLRGYELLPNASAEVSGVSYRSNSRGLRDREYDLAKPSGVFRIALLGSSHVLGLGVDVEKTFAWMLEERLPESHGARPEVWNFAFNGYGPLSQWDVLDERVAGTAPDAVVLIGHGTDIEWTIGMAARLYLMQTPALDPELVRILEAAGLKPGLGKRKAERLLRPVADDLVAHAYQGIAARIRSMGAAPVFIHLPLPGMPERTQFGDRLNALAQTAGFTVLHSNAVFEGQETDALRLSSWDGHYSPLAHELISARVIAGMQGSPVFAPVFTKPDGATPTAPAAP